MPVGGGSIFHKTTMLLVNNPQNRDHFSDRQIFLEQCRDFRDYLSQVVLPDFV